MSASNVTVSPEYSLFGVYTTGDLPRSATYTSPSGFGVSSKGASGLVKSNSICVAGVRSMLRTPLASVTIFATRGLSNSAVKRGMIESRESMRGFQKCARCQASLYFRPTRDRSGPMRRVENRCGMS